MNAPIPMPAKPSHPMNVYSVGSAVVALPTVISVNLALDWQHRRERRLERQAAKSRR